MESQDSQDFILKGIFVIKSKAPLQAVILLITSEKWDMHTTSVNVSRIGTLLHPQITYFIPGQFLTL